MANEISSMIMAQVPRPANESGQFVKVDSVKAPAVGGNALPKQGNDLPSQVDSKSTGTAEIKEAVSQINNFVQSVQRDLSFSMDEGSGRTIITVIDSNSGKMVRQIPSEEVLALATYLSDLGSSSESGGNIPRGILFSDNT